MAQSIVQGLFGPAPWEIQQQQAQQQQALAERFAQMNATQRGVMGMNRAGQQLGGMFAEGMGMVNPAVQAAQQRDAAMQGIDWANPQSIMQRANQVSDPRVKMQLTQMAQQMMAEKQQQQLAAQKGALDERKQDFQENEAMDMKRQQLAQAFEIAKMRSEDTRLGMQQRADAAKEANQIKLMLGQMMQEARMAGIEQRREATKAKTEGDVDKEKRNAVAFLKEAGYDPETGKDEVTDLIKKSTSGRGEALGAETAAFFGATTEGRKAINTLNATANRIVMALMGGKLGSGISNADREFIVGQLGDIGNANKTAEERLAAWNSAKNRMIDIGMVGSKPISAPIQATQPSTSKVVDFGSLK